MLNGIFLERKPEDGSWKFFLSEEHFNPIFMNIEFYHNQL